MHFSSFSCLQVPFLQGGMPYVCPMGALRWGFAYLVTFFLLHFLGVAACFFFFPLLTSWQLRHVIYHGWIVCILGDMYTIDGTSFMYISSFVFSFFFSRRVTLYVCYAVILLELHCIVQSHFGSISLRGLVVLMYTSTYNPNGGRFASPHVRFSLCIFCNTGKVSG